MPLKMEKEFELNDERAVEAVRIRVWSSEEIISAISKLNEFRSKRLTRRKIEKKNEVQFDSNQDIREQFNVLKDLFPGEKPINTRQLLIIARLRYLLPKCQQ